MVSDARAPLGRRGADRRVRAYDPRVPRRRNASGCLRAGPQRVGCYSVEVSALDGCPMLEFVQRLGIDRDVQAHLCAIGRAVGCERLGFVEKAVEFVGGDLVVVLHPYIMTNRPI